MMNPVRRAVCALGAGLLLAATARADTLLDIYELALENDPVLRAAQASFRAGQEFETIGRSALLPQIGAEASYSESDTTQKNERIFLLAGMAVTSRSDLDADDETESYGITLSQQLFNLPAWFTFQQGKELSKQAEAQFGADQQNLIVRVVDAYISVLRAIDNLKSSRAAEAAFQRQLEQTQQRFEVGLIAITDVHEAQAAYDLAVVNRLTDEGNLGVAYEALSVLTGQSHANLWLLSDDFPVDRPSPERREDWVEYALTGNFELRAAEYGSEAARQNSQAYKMEHLPKLTGSITMYDNSTDGSNNDNINTGNTYPFTSDVDGTQFQIRLAMPLYTGGRVSSQRRQSLEQYNAARESHTATMRNTIQATRSLHLAVVTNVERVKARRQAMVSAQSALDATTAGYEVGTRNVVDVLNAQRILFQSERDYANTRYDYVVSLLGLRKQAGMLSPEDIAFLNNWLIEPPAPTASGTP